MIGDSVLQNEDYEIETRPVRRRDAIEAGLDYWMDETDVMKERQRKIAFKNRKVCDVAHPAIIIVFCWLYHVELIVLHNFSSSILIYSSKLLHYIIGNGGRNIQRKTERRSCGTVQTKLDWNILTHNCDAIRCCYELSRVDTDTRDSDT